MFEERPSGVLVPAEKPPEAQGSWEPRFSRAHYFSDVQRFLELCDETPGARVEAVLTVPHLNIWGQKIGEQYIIIYQYTEPLEMEILT